MTSADFSQFVVTARLPILKPRLRDLPSYGRTLSGLYPLGLLSAVRIVIGLLLPLQHYPCLPALYQVLVHRANRLPPASFRFHLTMDTLAFGSSLPTIWAVWGLAPVRVRSCWANIQETDPFGSASFLFTIRAPVQSTMVLRPDGFQGGRPCAGATRAESHQSCCRRFPWCRGYSHLPLLWSHHL